MKLLVALDLSKCTEKILEQVKQIAKSLKADVWVMHNAEPAADVLEFKADPLSARESLAKKFHQEHLQVQEIAEQFRSEGLEATGLLVHGATVEIILDTAERLDVNMIVLGTHGRGAMYQLILGSVSAGVLHKSRRPVLLIPTHKNTDATVSPTPDSENA